MSLNKLSQCVEGVLQLMIDKKCKSMCLLAISTGIFNFPLDECVKVYRNTIIKFIDKNTEQMNGKEIILCKKSYSFKN